jgi:hypothetical protein
MIAPLPGKSPAKKKPDSFALKEVLHQLGNLSCTIQKVSDQTQALAISQSRQQAEFNSFKVSWTPGIPVTSGPVNPPPIVNVTPAIPAIPNPLPAGLADPSAQNNALDLPIPLHNGARIAKKTYLSARTGEFVHLPEFAPNNEPSAIMESVLDNATGQLVFKSKNIKKSLDCFLTWSRAWAGYEALLVSIFPALYLSLTDYRLFIQGCDALYHWSAVSAYDQRHRHRQSLTHSFEFQTCSTDIYISTLNATTIRPNPKTCYGCGSIDHNMKDCPFSKQPVKNSNPKRNQNYPSAPPKLTQNFTPRSDAQAYGESRQVVCFNWNQGRCSSVACWRTHVCSGCGGPEPHITCSRCNSTKGLVLLEGARLGLCIVTPP